MAVAALFFAITFASLANFFIQKNINLKGSSEGYLISSFTFSFLTLGFSFQEIYQTPLSFGMLFTGMIAGSLIFLLMKLTSKALQYGPAGLTFAFQISGSIFPGLLLYYLFGTAYGFMLTAFITSGLVLIIIGLFWSANLGEVQFHSKTGQWLTLAIAIFTIHLLFTSIIQGRSLLFSESPEHFLLVFHCAPEQDIWFMVGMLSFPLILHALTVLKSGRWPSRAELTLGSFGGLSNGISTYFLLFATENSPLFLKSILFPSFSIGIIVFCNLWGQIFFAERVNWRANALALCGIILASF